MVSEAQNEIIEIPSIALSTKMPNINENNGQTLDKLKTGYENFDKLN